MGDEIFDEKCECGGTLVYDYTEILLVCEDCKKEY